MADPRVSAVVLAYGAELTLDRCVEALLASTGVDVDVVVVDNGGPAETLAELGRRERVEIVGPATNRGFAGGCNVGVERSDGAYVALINSDAFVAPEALQRLVEVASRPSVGIASADLRLDDQPDAMNSTGNPVHYTGLTWSGGFGEPATFHTEEASVTSATGAAMVLSRELWDRLGGFDDAFFAYVEDTELSLRCRQLGLDIRYVPGAVVRHQYEFSRNNLKFELLERNRLLMILTLYELRTLVVLAPVLGVFELAVLVQAIAGGWWRAKLNGWLWLIRHARHVRERRRWVQSVRVIPDREMLDCFTARIEPSNVEGPPLLWPFNILSALYWSVARRLLVRPGS